MVEVYLSSSSNARSFSIPRHGHMIFINLSFDLAAFNVGDYYRSVVDKLASENITKVLYPNDEA